MTKKKLKLKAIHTLGSTEHHTKPGELDDPKPDHSDYWPIEGYYRTDYWAKITLDYTNSSRKPKMSTKFFFNHHWFSGQRVSNFS